MKQTLRKLSSCLYGQPSGLLRCNCIMLGSQVKFIHSINDDPLVTTQHLSPQELSKHWRPSCTEPEHRNLGNSSEMQAHNVISRKENMANCPDPNTATFEDLSCKFTLQCPVKSKLLIFQQPRTKDRWDNHTESRSKLTRTGEFWKGGSPFLCSPDSSTEEARYNCPTK